MGKTISLTGYPEATRGEPSNHNHPLSHSRYALSSKSSGEHVDIVLVFLALKLESLSLQNAAFLRLPGPHPRSLQAQIQACVILLNLSGIFWPTSDPQRRVSLSSRRTSLTSGLVTSSTSRPTEPNRRVCHTNTTMGSSRDLVPYHIDLYVTAAELVSCTTSPLVLLVSSSTRLLATDTLRSG